MFPHKNIKFMPRCIMEFYVEARDPQRDLGGLCECFIAENQGLCTVARPHVH